METVRTGTGQCFIHCSAMRRGHNGHIDPDMSKQVKRVWEQENPREMAIISTWVAELRAPFIEEIPGEDETTREERLENALKCISKPLTNNRTLAEFIAPLSKRNALAQELNVAFSYCAGSRTLRIAINKAMLEACSCSSCNQPNKHSTAELEKAA